MIETKKLFILAILFFAVLASNHAQEISLLNALIKKKEYSKSIPLKNGSFEDGTEVSISKRVDRKPILSESQLLEVQKQIKNDSLAAAYRVKQRLAQIKRKNLQLEKESLNNDEKEEKDWRKSKIKLGKTVYDVEIIVPNYDNGTYVNSKREKRRTQKEIDEGNLNGDFYRSSDYYRTNIGERIPKHWLDANLHFPNRTPATLHDKQGLFGVQEIAKSGKMYISLVTRKEGSFESIAQQLDKDLQKNVPYAFSFYSSSAEVYFSPWPGNEYSKSYAHPVLLKVWLTNSNFDRDQLIYNSISNNNSSWKEHLIEFTPNSNYQFIVIEVEHIDKRSYGNGSILLDKFSHIYFH